MFRILKFIWNHPLNRDHKLRAIGRFIKWQLASRIWGGEFVFNWVSDSKLIVENGMTGATGNIYVGLMEYKDMSFVLHYLRDNDVFFDVGANVGVYTILASKVKNAKTVSIEPLPNTFDKLVNNININRLTNVVAMNIGLSHEKAKLFFTTNKDTMNRIATDRDKNTKEVDVETLDNLSSRFGYPKLIKMDVEGYETMVLKGANKTLLSDEMEAIIIELNGSGEALGFDESLIHQNLIKNGFSPYEYNPFKRKLTRLNTYGAENTIYIKDSIVERIAQEVKIARKFLINGIQI